MRKIPKSKPHNFKLEKMAIFSTCTRKKQTSFEIIKKLNEQSAEVNKSFSPHRKIYISNTFFMHSKASLQNAKVGRDRLGDKYIRGQVYSMNG